MGRPPNNRMNPSVLRVGWRLRQHTWGKGYATEAAHAALTDAFRRVHRTEVLAYTSGDNRRSQAVMRRLRLWRDELRDFEIYNDRLGSWRGLVWSATPSSFTGSVDMDDKGASGVSAGPFADRQTGPAWWRRDTSTSSSGTRGLVHDGRRNVG